MPDDLTADDLFAVIGKLYVETLVLKKQVSDVSKAAYDLQARGFFDDDHARTRRDDGPDDPGVPPLRREVPPA